MLGSGLFVFLLCAFLLVVGYFVYGAFAERVYGFDRTKAMPCTTHPDGVDFVAMPMWKVFLVQLLNIAGLGPVFGALSGCLFGPACLLWIVLGCIFGGAMHDFLSALMSADHDGENLPGIVGRHLGGVARHTMRVVCIALLVLVGVVFTKGPAAMLHGLVGQISVGWWSVIIIGYYFLATILPINTVIGRVYPYFGVLFVGMSVSLAVCLPFCGLEVMPDLAVWENRHPSGVPVWPMIFVTIACGAISGFHATQSPMMVRCLSDARGARRVFYGAMIAEGLVALIWAVVGMTLREVLTPYVMHGKEISEAATGEVMMSFAQLSLANPALAVNHACRMLLGPVGAVLAVLGVVVLPITSGDTAMRSCRLLLADALGIRQVMVRNRLLLAVPLFVVVIVMSEVDFSVIWRYFGWSNQLLSCFTLWSIAVCLRKRGRRYGIALLPALFMSAMCLTYLLYAPECGIELSLGVSTAAGIAGAGVLLVLFGVRVRASAEEMSLLPSEESVGEVSTR